MGGVGVVEVAGTIVSYASGNAGGIFGPSLFIGAMAGGAVGMAVHRLAPFPTADPGAYALVGMGTLFAGIIRAPMTSVFMIFEITQDYQILVPLMVANMLSFVISRRYQPVPVYHALLHQDDVHLPSAATQGAPTRTARSLMHTRVTLVSPDTSVRQARQMMAESDTPAFLVGSRDNLLASLSIEDLDEQIASGRADASLASVLDGGPIVHVHPDHPIDVVIERFSQTSGLLPVVSRVEARHLEGVITSDSILKSARQGARPSSTQTPPEGQRPHTLAPFTIPRKGRLCYPSLKYFGLKVSWDRWRVSSHVHAVLDALHVIAGLSGHCRIDDSGRSRHAHADRGNGRRRSPIGHFTASRRCGSGRRRPDPARDREWRR